MKRKINSNRRQKDFGEKPANFKSTEKRETKTFAHRDSRKPENENSERLSKTSSSIVFGLSPVLELLKAHTRPIDKLLIAEGIHEHRISKILALAKELRIPFQKIPRSKFLNYVEAETVHQGVLAFTASADYADADELFREIAEKAQTSEKALAVVLDGVEDPRNLGAILRTVDCVGADGVFIPERRAVGLTETVAKTSAGAAEYVKTAKVVNIADLIDDLKQQNIWTIGASSEAEMNYTDWDWTQNCALVMGSEGKGLRRLVAEKCDILVKIPMRGKIESLNVSAAAAVILFEARRQRDKARNAKQQQDLEE